MIISQHVKSLHNHNYMYFSSSLFFFLGTPSVLQYSLTITSHTHGIPRMITRLISRGTAANHSLKYNFHIKYIPRKRQ